MPSAPGNWPTRLSNPAEHGSCFSSSYFPAGVKGGDPRRRQFVEQGFNQGLIRCQELGSRLRMVNGLGPRLVTRGRHTRRTCPSTVAPCATTAKPVWCELGAIRL